MGKWKEIPLEDCMEQIIDYRGKTPEKSDYGVLLITAKIIKDGRINFNTKQEYISEEEYKIRMTRGIPKKGDVVITTEAPLGEVGQLDEKKVAIGQRIITLRGKPDLLDNTFLKYLLQSKKVQARIREKETGTTVTGIKQKELRKISLPIPPLLTQKLIVNQLGTLDDKIELNRQMNQTLEAMASVIFKSWFVDFDPVYAKMEGRNYPLPPEIMDLFPDELEESELELVPKGWRVGDIIELIKFYPKYSIKNGDKATYLEMKNVPEFGYYPINWVKREFVSGTKFSNGDTLLARITPCLENGKTAHINFLEENEIGWGSTEYIVMRTIPPIPKFFSFLLARNLGFREFAIKSMTGSSGRQRVQLDRLKSFKIPIPDNNKIFVKFNEIVEPLILKMKINYEQTRILQQSRDILLPKLLSGDFLDWNYGNF